jgi:hypothetical protein
MFWIFSTILVAFVILTIFQLYQPEVRWLWYSIVIYAAFVTFLVLSIWSLAKVNGIVAGVDNKPIMILKC